MLLGEYHHTLDSKNRLTLPAKFKNEVGTKLMLTRGLERSLFLYSMHEWEKISERLATLPMTHPESRGFSRFFLSGAVEVELDKAGRFVVSEPLKKFAQLNKKIVLTGVQSRIELWDEDVWEQYKQQIEQDAEMMAEKLGEIGVI